MLSDQEMGEGTYLNGSWLVLLEEHDILSAGQVDKKVKVRHGSVLDVTGRWFDVIQFTLFFNYDM